jgi:hypothetical protein
MFTKCNLFEIFCMGTLMIVWWPKLVADKVNKTFGNKMPTRCNR